MGAPTAGEGGGDRSGIAVSGAGGWNAAGDAGGGSAGASNGGVSTVGGTNGDSAAGRTAGAAATGGKSSRIAGGTAGSAAGVIGQFAASHPAVPCNPTTPAKHNAQSHPPRACPAGPVLGWDSGQGSR